MWPMTTEQPNPTFAHDQPMPPRPLAAQRLRRRTSDRVLGGVAGGLADYLNVDPVLVRVAFAGLMIFGGAGFPLYVLGWLLIPAADANESIGEDWLRGLASRLGLVGGVILVVGFLLFGGQIVDRFGSGRFYLPSEVWIALAITLVGILLLVTRGNPPATGAATGVAAAPARSVDAPPAEASSWASAAPAWSPPAGAGAPGGMAPAADPIVPPPGAWSPAASALAVPGAWAAPGAWASPAPVAREPAAPRERSPLGWYAVAAALVALAIAAMIDGLPEVRVLPGQYAGAGLLVLGVALLVGAWWGRARLLILLGLLALPFAFVSAFLTVPLDGGFGDREFRPTSASELQSAYSIAGGRLSIDLTSLDIGAGSVDVTASAGLGRVSIIVPADAMVDVTATVQGGELDILGRHQQGTGLSDRVLDATRGPGPTIRLTMDAGIGEVWVQRSSLETN